MYDKDMKCWVSAGFGFVAVKGGDGSSDSGCSGAPSASRWLLPEHPLLNILHLNNDKTRACSAVLLAPGTSPSQCHGWMMVNGFSANR